MIDQKRISSLITDKAVDLVKQMVPSIADMASKIGIKDITSIPPTLPDTCLPKTELDQIISLRDKLKNNLNSVADIINKLSEPIDFLNKAVLTTSATLLVLKTTRAVTKTAIKAIPSPPGAPGVIVSTLDDIKDLVDFLTPKVAIAQITITSIEVALDFANNILIKILGLLDTIDQYIKKCGGPNGPKNNDYLNKVVDTDKQLRANPNPTNEIYNGFALEIVKEPYSSTVDRRQAVAKNNNGIVLLKTPLSFTTDDKTLIAELKLIIDKNNLKAY